MSPYRFTPSLDLDQKLKDIAAKQRKTVDGILPSLVADGARHAEYGLFRRAIHSLLAAVPTALVVVTVLLLVKIVADIPVPAPISDDILLRGLHWLRVAIVSMFPWPITIIVAFWFLFGRPSAFTRLLDVFRMFRRVRILGTEIELNEETRSKIQSATSEITDALEEYKKRVSDEMKRLASRHQLDGALGSFVDKQIIERFTREQIGSEYRCTIHVPDPVSERRLSQLLDYYPKGGGAFRTFSERYGIIGKVWRTENSEVVGTLFAGLPSGATPEQKIERIMRDWGMERREAERALDRPSYLCFLLKHDDRKLGVIYMDSKKEDAFGTGGSAANAGKVTGAEETVEAIQQEANKLLAPKIAKLFDDLAPVSIRIFEG
jgi:hypothetical protein